ncbi:hypothetical protein VP01_1868g2 [Puccinia sorghi]|uniref:Palmitoyltransferase n=1 Tax=Puccinia sorghi TaxID=27349 RepID=A0A0L6VDF2_9BASI|nr:hypothetical protein VP01_1868g2 [Puccinia sorghi]
MHSQELLSRNSFGLSSRQSETTQQLPQLPLTTTTTSTTTTLINQQRTLSPQYNNYPHSPTPSFLDNQTPPSSTSQINYHHERSSPPKLPQSQPLDSRSYSGVLEIRMPTSQLAPETTPTLNNPHQLPNINFQPQSKQNITFFNKTQLQHDQGNYSTNPLIVSEINTTSKPPPPRVYQSHPGNLIFCCRGRLVSSKPAHSIPLTRTRKARAKDLDQRPQKRLYLPLQTLASLLLLLGIPILFLYSTAPALVAHSAGGVLLVALFCYLWMICLSSMAKTVSSDPGILPRGLDPNPDMRWTPATMDPPAEPIISVQPPHQSITQPDGEKPFGYEQVGEWEVLPRWIKIENNIHPSRLSSANNKLDPNLLSGEEVGWIQSKWCTTCESYRPPRSSHCRLCDCCIDGIDHHCSYLNVSSPYVNCIGSRNYRSFFVFLMTSVMSLLMIIGCTIWKLFFNLDRLNNWHVLANLKHNPIIIFVLCITFLLVLPISALLGYHMFLTCNGLTTVEYIKSQTTKRVIKENKKLVNQIYRGQQQGAGWDGGEGLEEEGGVGGGRAKRFWTTLLRRLFLINPEPESHQARSNHPPHPHLQDIQHPNSHKPPTPVRRSNNLIIGRLCRPDTDTYIDWTGVI